MTVQQGQIKEGLGSCC